MKLSRFEIERFGHFTRRTFELGDAAEPTFFFGRNEAGKSTLLAFLRELLFGFQEKSRYDLGGAAEVAGNAHATLANGETISFRRRKGRKNTVSGVIGSPPRSFDEAELAGFVGQANASLFASVFAFGLAELEQGQKSLESAKLESALYGGALGGGRDVKAITEALDAQIGAIFNPKGRTQPILETAARLKELNDQLREASLRSVDYTAAVERARERNERVATLTTRIDALKKELPVLDALAKGAPLVERRRRYAAELTELGTSDDRRFVEHGAEIRLLANDAREIAELRAKLDTAAAKNDAEREELAAAAKALDSTWEPARIVREAPTTASLASLQELSRTRARLEERETAAKATVADAEKRHETATAVASAVGEAPTRELVAAKRARRDEAIALLGKPDDLWVNRERKVWLAGDKTPFGEAVKKAVLDADAAVDALLSRGAEDATRTAAHLNAKRTAEELARAKLRLAEAQATLLTFDRQWPEKAGAFGLLAPPEACLLAQHVADLAARTRLADERRMQIESGRKRVATHTERVDRLAKMLLEEPLVEGTSAISVLLKHVERADRAARATHELDQLDRQIADLAPTTDDLAGWTEQLANVNQLELDAERAQLRRALADAEKSRSATLREAGVADANRASLDGSSRAARLATDVEARRAELAGLVDRVAPLMIARQALGDSIARFERDNQPALLVAISALLCRITSGKWVRVAQRFSEKKLRVVDARGEERTFDELSTGTREQLYLAIRLAFVEGYCEKNEPLPVVMDDVFVNFDAERARGAFSTLEGLAKKTQVCFFTCHESQLTIARQVFPKLKPIEI